MVIDLHAAEREHCLRLLHEGGPGWFPFVLRKADALESSDPQTYRGLVAEMEAEIAKTGPQAVDAARRAAKWMEAR